MRRSRGYSRLVCLVRNTMAKYGIPEAHMYNFDETGFLMGIIATMMVVTSAERQGKPKSK